MLKSFLDCPFFLFILWTNNLESILLMLCANMHVKDYISAHKAILSEEGISCTEADTVFLFS